MPVDRIEDIMSYYHFGIIPLYCLALITLILFIGSLKTKALSKYAMTGAAVTVVACISHDFFLGVLADNQAVIGPWVLQTNILAGLSVVLLVLLIKGIRRK